MPRSETFLEAAISFYSNLGFRTVAAMRSSQEDLRTGNFQFEKVAGSAALLWLDAAEGWLSALLATASEPLPTIFLRIGPQSSSVAREVHVLIPGRERLESTGLLQIGGTERIDDAIVVITASADRDRLEVKLKGLKDNPPKAGLYTALVHIRDVPLAIVMVHVDPTAGEGGPVAQSDVYPKDPRASAV